MNKQRLLSGVLLLITLVGGSIYLGRGTSRNMAAVSTARNSLTFPVALESPTNSPIPEEHISNVPTAITAASIPTPRPKPVSTVKPSPSSMPTPLPTLDSRFTPFTPPPPTPYKQTCVENTAQKNVIIAKWNIQATQLERNHENKIAELNALLENDPNLKLGIVNGAYRANIQAQIDTENKEYSTDVQLYLAQQNAELAAVPPLCS